MNRLKRRLRLLNDIIATLLHESNFEKNWNFNPTKSTYHLNKQIT
jgi:hypothetical protein